MVGSMSLFFQSIADPTIGAEVEVIIDKPEPTTAGPENHVAFAS
jgi:hypothetical protein